MPETAPAAVFDLVSMYEELSVAPRTGIVRNTTEAWLSRNQIQSGAIPGSDPSGFSDTSIKSLLRFLFGQIDTSGWSPKRLRVRRDKILAEQTAVALGEALHTALELDPSAYPSAPALLGQLTWCALLIELEPPEQRRYSHLGGLDLCSPDMTGRNLRRELVRHLKSKTRAIDGFRSPDEARLAVSLLEPLYPELARDDLPRTLYCGSLAWSTLTHAIAFAEALRPGSSVKMDSLALEQQLLTASETKNEEELRIIAATGIRPALHWAVAQGKVAHREDGDYSEKDLVTAQKQLDERRDRAARSVSMLFSHIPDRFEMARQKLREAYAGTALWPEYPLTPVGLGTQWKYFSHEYVDWKANEKSRFNLFDLFVAGRTVNGEDEFRADPIKHKPSGGYLIAPDLDRLRGINMVTLFDEAFDEYWKNSRDGYEFLVETLFEQIPHAERKYLKQNPVYIYALREQKTFPASAESAQEREWLRGRMGFIIQCIDSRHPARIPIFSYEVFPLQAHIVKRTDLSRFPSHDLTQNNGDARHSIAVDWQAYLEGRVPLPEQTANLVPVLLHAFGPAEALSRNLQRAARQIADKHMFFYRDQLYAQQRGKAFVEEIEEGLSVALTVWSVFVPGLGCYNALRAHQHLGITIPTCALDIASILLLPAVGLGAGVAKLALSGGQVIVAGRLTGLAGMTGRFLKAAAGSYMAALNPVQMLMPVYWGGKLLYRYGSRGILALSRLRALTGVSRTGRAFTLPSPLAPSTNRIRNVEDLDDFLRQHEMFGSSESVRRQRRQGTLDLLEDGAEVRVHTRPDGTKTLITPDEIVGRQVTYIDLANDTTVTMGGFYNYRQLRSWKPVADSAEANIISVPTGQVSSTRSMLQADRLTSIKTAIEEGVPLPALDVTGVPQSYSVVNGNHRLQAARDLGLETIPIKVAIARETAVVAASQMGYTANYGLHVRGLLVVPAILSQTRETGPAHPSAGKVT
jgi:hypothetical protein